MTGHIRKRGANSYEIKFDIGADPVTGKRRIRYHSFRGSKREAQIELARLVTDNAKGEYVDPSKMTVAEFFDKWDRDHAALNVGAKTLERYRQIIRLQIKPNIGALPLQKLRTSHLAGLYAKLQRGTPQARRKAIYQQLHPETKKGAAQAAGMNEALGRGGQSGHDVAPRFDEAAADATGQSERTVRALSARTVGHVHRLLHRALKDAVKWGVIVQNPAANASAPRVASTEISILSQAQIGALLTRIKGTTLHPIIFLMLTTGARRGEVLALRWRDIDLDAGKIRIERSLEQTKAGLRFKEPKTKRSRRTITIPPATVAELKAHRKAQQERRLKLGLGRAPDDSLAFQKWDGATRSPHWLTQKFAIVAGALAFAGVTLHSLRHTHASQLIASGMDVLTISRRLGHANATVTLNTYGHLFTNTDDRAAAIMQAAFGGLGTE